MSYSITVHLPYEQIPYPTNPDEQDAWYEHYLKHVIFERPLGTDSMIYNYWHLPALSIDLKLIAQIYDNGLEVKEPDALMLLREEIKTLSNYWHENLLIAVASESKVDLLNRLFFLHEAIEIALNTNGKLNIS
ncbi:hypothetical protein ACFQI7_16255 [Paenibacillus allorhizosphaerae]|uniref:Uncharacterized protein n=1 Tax=Paenibacillus allorhizosphaerae TaxID=2849866 RepID=A0ABM8VUT6_9BACL|nr:hypothetical protein [Paenibacillus allorhizosphaerae]CAG7658843.1 hypothetical protein PAECIP111802_07186 [Paenibacillus allorhizosphaerae]